MATGSRPDWVWELALAVNATFKGLLASSGQSGHICKRVVPIETWLETSDGWQSIREHVVRTTAGQLEDGDVVVIAEKVVAASLGRFGPRELILAPDPKTIAPESLPELARRWENRLGFVIKPIHLLLADEFGVDQCTVGVDDHNMRCAELAQSFRDQAALVVDVIISDTDTGLDTRSPLIGTITIGATPIGATRGVNLYEAMRCAAAAEFTRGHDRGIPVVVCKPADRRRSRVGISEHRGYSGFLHIDHERGVAHA